ncbi:BTB/POZ domain-containing protein KCTD17 [Tetrabaena socialis]|uniref:BTB/POZ domain-containing protein KCTD17 n=1 Tax=Tetrabaena socialis TaxID=47790 RepID=A0A2J8A6G2_9CHLO|nr:BTB/POZ domain-containing protein KCTD17 [Tetrabaena socialis]|eukprot:PNH08087.1 BTB/POZ domain-containing protein KCTD17 [Tetrabaena socialis]
MNDSFSVVSFNVGGQQFTTAKETLLKEGNSRLALVARGVLSSIKDPSGAILVDRDPKYFQSILNFLRDGWCLLPGSAQERRELLQEVRFYQLSGFEGWLRTQEVLADAGGYNAQEYVAMESPRPRIYHPGQQMGTIPFSPYATMGPYASPGGTSGPPGSPHASAAAGAQAWLPSGGTASAATFSGLSPQHHQHFGHTLGMGATLGRTSPARSTAPPSTAPPGGGGMTGNWGGGGGGGAGGSGRQGGVIASLREAFLTATGPQRPAAHVAAYSLPSGPEDGSASWTSKYLRGNEGLRELVNTLLELAFVAPHSSRSFSRRTHGGSSSSWQREVVHRAQPRGRRLSTLVALEGHVHS